MTQDVTDQTEKNQSSLGQKCDANMCMVDSGKPPRANGRSRARTERRNKASRAATEISRGLRDVDSVYSKECA